jgi:tetratricopeptide (TPR) repeat protein
MTNHQSPPTVALCPKAYANRPGVPTWRTRDLQNARVVSVDADFASGGTWAGVAALVEHAYHACVEAGANDLILRHNYELHMALPALRDRIPLLHGCLTDTADGIERTRGFPPDRAYRIVHGLVDFLIGWRNLLHTDETLLVVFIEGLAKAQHLGERFIFELARRGSSAANMVVALPGADAARVIAATAPRFTCVAIELPGTPITLDVTGSGRPIGTEAEAEDCFAALGNTKTFEIQSRRLRAYYRAAGNDLGYAKASLAALGACNHFGYYHEGRAFLPDVLPYIEEIIDGDEERRVNYTGHVYHSLVGNGAFDDARLILEKLVLPYLTRNSLRARIEYVLGIHALRFSGKPDLEAAETHFLAATQFMAEAVDELEPDEFCFQRVFIDNGLALLRVRQGRKSEAIALCQSGYKLLDAALSPQTHKLHRSVLQYNTGQVYNLMGDHEAALHYYDLAITMDPNYSEYYNDMGNIFQRQGRFDDALTAYDMAVRLSPPYSEVHFNRALCLARRGDWDTAVTACRRSLDLNPDQLDAQLVLAEMCQQLGSLQEAADCYTHAIELAPSSVIARVNKAVTFFNMERFEDALAAIETAIALEPDEPDHHEKRAAILSCLNQRDSCQPGRQAAKQGREVAETAA